VSGGGVRDEDILDGWAGSPRCVCVCVCVCERKETAGGAHFQNSHPHNKLER
jgi:hypothetical protein